MVGLSRKTKSSSHPPAELALKLGGEPKTENWYVVKAVIIPVYSSVLIRKFPNLSLKKLLKKTRLKVLQSNRIEAQ